MKQNKKDRLYHKIMKKKRDSRYNPEKENPISLVEEKIMFHICRGKLKPYYKGKRMEENRKRRYGKRKIIEKELEL